MKRIWKTKEGGFWTSRLPQKENENSRKDELPALLAALRDLPDESFWRECFGRYPQTASWPAEKMDELGRRASVCGEEQAVRFAGQSLEGLYGAHGLHVGELEQTQASGMMLFALFEAPDRVLLRSDLLEAAEDYVKSTLPGLLREDLSCRALILAHEFYHYLECREDSELFTAAYRERSGLLGLPAVVPALGEIGAMSFARRLLSLEWNPFLLDCVMLAGTSPHSAAAIAKRLLASARPGEGLVKQEKERSE